MAKRATTSGKNQLLAALPASDFALLKPHLKQVELKQGTLLQEQGERIDYVYFPNSGMVSLAGRHARGKLPLKRRR